MAHRKLVLRVGAGVAAIVVAALIGVAFFPAPAYRPPTRELKDESAYDFDAKVGWYRFPDNSERLLTWHAENGLVMYALGETRDDLDRIRFSPITTETLVSKNSNAQTRLKFLNSSQAQLIDADGNSQTINRSTRARYHTREVSFASDSIDLSGLLFVPSGPGPHPAVVLIHGSGVSNRDSFWYLSPADYLAQRGVMVLLPDKRGCGKSQGEWHTASFDDFAGDALAGVKLLSEEHSVDQQKIGLVGLSQGGWIAPLAASKSRHVAFVVTVSGSVATPREQLAYEVRNEIAASGAPSLVASALAPLFSRRARMPRKLWWDLNGRFDPIDYWSALTVPALLIFGEEDANVDVQRSMARLDSAGVLNRRGVEVRVFKELGHGMIREDTRWLEPEYLARLSEFIKPDEGSANP